MMITTCSSLISTTWDVYPLIISTNTTTRQCFPLTAQREPQKNLAVHERFSPIISQLPVEGPGWTALETGAPWS